MLAIKHNSAFSKRNQKKKNFWPDEIPCWPAEFNLVNPLAIFEANLIFVLKIFSMEATKGAFIKPTTKPSQGKRTGTGASSLQHGETTQSGDDDQWNDGHPDDPPAPAAAAVGVPGDPEPHGHLEAAEERDGGEHPVVGAEQRAAAAEEHAGGRRGPGAGEREEERGRGLGGAAADQGPPELRVVVPGRRGVRHVRRHLRRRRGGHVDAERVHGSSSAGAGKMNFGVSDRSLTGTYGKCSRAAVIALAVWIVEDDVL